MSGDDRRVLAGLTGAVGVAILAAAAHGARPPWLLLGWVRTAGPGLLAAALVLTAAIGVGLPLARRLLPDLEEAPRRVVALGLGLAALELLASYAGSVGLLGAPLAWAVALVGAGVAAKASVAWGRTVHGRGNAVGWLLAAWLFPTLLVAAAPPLGPDEVQYHRRFVEHAVRTGGLTLDALDPVSALAQGLHGLLALATHVGGPASGRSLCLLLGLAGLAAAGVLARELFGRGAATLTLLVGLGATAMLRHLPTMNTDLVQAPLLVGAAMVALHGAASGSRRGALGALGVLAGAAFGIKYTAALFFAPFWLLLLPRSRRDAAAWLGAALLPLLWAAPWLVRNHLEHGAALAPFVGLAGPEGLQAAFRFNHADHYGPGSGTAAVLRAPWDLLVLGREFDRRLYLGRLNPWPLVALPAIMAGLRAGGPRRLALATGLGCLLWALLLRRAVYLLPAWPVLAALTGGALASLGGQRLQAGLVGFLALWGTAELASPWQDGLASAPVATGQRSWAEHEAGDEGDAIAWLARNASAEDAVLHLWSWGWWGAPQRPLYIGAEEFTPLRAALLRAGDAARFAEQLRAESTRWVITRPVSFPRSSFPELTDVEWQQGFARPLAIGEELLRRHGIERFRRGQVAIYELR